MRDVAGHVVVFLMNVTVEDRDVLVRHQGIDDGRRVAGRPVPLWVEIEEWPMGERHDGRVAFQLPEVRLQPLELRLADDSFRVRDIIQHYEMHALVIEGVMKIAEKFLISFAPIERRVMLSGHKAQGLDLELTGDLPELSHPLSSRFRIVRGMSQVAGEHDAVGLFIEAIDRRDGFLQRAPRVWVDFRTVKAPVGIGELDEIKFIRACSIISDRLIMSDPLIMPALSEDARAQPRSEYYAAYAGELQKIASIEFAHDYPSFVLANPSAVEFLGARYGRALSGPLRRSIYHRLPLHPFPSVNSPSLTGDRAHRLDIPAHCRNIFAGIKSRRGQSYYQGRNTNGEISACRNQINSPVLSGPSCRIWTPLIIWRAG